MSKKKDGVGKKIFRFKKEESPEIEERLTGIKKKGTRWFKIRSFRVIEKNCGLGFSIRFVDKDEPSEYIDCYYNFPEDPDGTIIMTEKFDEEMQMLEIDPVQNILKDEIQDQVKNKFYVKIEFSFTKGNKVTFTNFKFLDVEERKAGDDVDDNSYCDSSVQEIEKDDDVVEVEQEEDGGSDDEEICQDNDYVDIDDLLSDDDQW